MTSASELFCNNRRSRYGRNSDQYDVGSSNLISSPPPPFDRINRRYRNNYSGGRRDRIDTEACDPLRRALHNPPPRQPPLHRPTSNPPPQERASARFEEGPQSHQFPSGNVGQSGNQGDTRDRPQVSGNDRLPGSVLLARERLMQRLRGVTLSSSRRSNRNSSRSHQTDIGDDFRLVDAGDWETELPREWLGVIAPLPGSINQQTSKRPPGLTQEALECLHVEEFHIPEERDEEDMSKALKVCSICLESFSEGDVLICLPCGHRYHFCCLGPWVRTCGDCPYCRRGINVTTHGGVK